MEMVASFAATSLIALIHILVGHRAFKPREGSAWLSAAGGASVAYVFIYVLPKLARKQEQVDEHIGFGVLSYLEHHVYLVAMIGLIFYHSIHRIAEFATVQRTGNKTDHANLAAILHIGSFLLYGFIIGHLFASFLQKTYMPLTLASVTFALHFIGTDLELKHKYQAFYADRVRWLLVASLYVGWLVGELTVVPVSTEILLFSFLAGAIIINVMREKIPQETQIQMLAFLGGAVAYAILVLFAFEYVFELI